MNAILKKILFAILLLLVPSVNFGQTPNWGATANFALFTAVGAFNSVGATNVTGDIGTNVGSFSGYPPGIVVGEIHVADSISAEAAIDVGIAYSYFSSITCGEVLGTTLGNSQVLTANTYCLGAASTLNGNLILDGQGDTNAIFVFKIDGVFETSLLSNVFLINATSVYNVYWQINGMVTLGDNSNFNGNIVANGAIKLLEGAKLHGRALSQAGAIELHNNNVIMVSMPALPVELVFFTADVAEGNLAINLRWQTASESNSALFKIEASIDGYNFKTIGELDAAGQSNQLLSYFFTDEHPNFGINFYRLNQIDINGAQEYSPVRAVRFSNAVLPVKIYPNPVKGQEVFVDISQLSSTLENVTISCSDMHGRILSKTKFDYTPKVVLHLPENYAGAYFFIRIQQGEFIQNTFLMRLL